MVQEAWCKGEGEQGEPQSGGEGEIGERATGKGGGRKGPGTTSGSLKAKKERKKVISPTGSLGMGAELCGLRRGDR